MTPPIRLYMSMSLDGFIAGPDDRTGQELGRNGGRLFNWLDDRMSPGTERPGVRRGAGDRRPDLRTPHLRARRPLGR